MSTDNPEVEPESLFYPEPDENQDEPAAELDEVAEDEVEAEDDTEEVESEAEDDEPDTEVEEDADSEEEQDSDDESYVDLNGREITVAQIKAWEKGHLMQSDYTKKTQALSKERKEFEASKETAVKKLADDKYKAIDDSIAEMQALISNNEESIDWDDLREYDEAEFNKQTLLKQSRENAIAKAKEQRSNAEAKERQEALISERELLVSDYPEWLDSDGKPTKEYDSQMATVNDYFKAKGWTAKQQESLVTAKAWVAVIEAANHLKKGSKVVETKKKIKKLPVTTKPKKSTAGKGETLEKLFYG
jgi:hypothetical protein